MATLVVPHEAQVLQGSALLATPVLLLLERH